MPLKEVLEAYKEMESGKRRLGETDEPGDIFREIKRAQTSEPRATWSAELQNPVPRKSFFQGTDLDSRVLPINGRDPIDPNSRVLYGTEWTKIFREKLDKLEGNPVYMFYKALAGSTNKNIYQLMDSENIQAVQEAYERESLVSRAQTQVNAIPLGPLKESVEKSEEIRRRVAVSYNLWKGVLTTIARLMYRTVDRDTIDLSKLNDAFNDIKQLSPSTLQESFDKDFLNQLLDPNPDIIPLDTSTIALSPRNLQVLKDIMAMVQGTLSTSEVPEYLAQLDFICRYTDSNPEDYLQDASTIEDFRESHFLGYISFNSEEYNKYFNVILTTWIRFVKGEAVPPPTNTLRTAITTIMSEKKFTQKFLTDYASVKTVNNILFDQIDLSGFYITREPMESIQALMFRMLAVLQFAQYTRRLVELEREIKTLEEKISTIAEGNIPRPPLIPWTEKQTFEWAMSPLNSGRLLVKDSVSNAVKKALQDVLRKQNISVGFTKELWEALLKTINFRDSVACYAGALVNEKERANPVEYKSAATFTLIGSMPGNLMSELVNNYELKLVRTKKGDVIEINERGLIPGTGMLSQSVQDERISAYIHGYY